MRSIFMVPVMVVGMLFGNTSLNNQAPIASSAAIDETVIIKNIGTSEYRGIVSHDEFIRVIGRTDWPSELWPYVWMVSRCEATGPTDDTINQGLVGDGGLVGTGPSVGAMMINTAAHPEIMQDYDVYELYGNLQAGYIVYQEASMSWWPWLHCANKIGLYTGR